jgi:hypothetical protein
LKKVAKSAGVPTSVILKQRQENKKRQVSTRWEPENLTEELYAKYMGELNSIRKRHSSKPVDELLAAVETEQDFQFALRVWRVLSYRNIKFRPETTLALVKKFAQFNDLDSVVDSKYSLYSLYPSRILTHGLVMMNSTQLRVNIDDVTVREVIDMLIKTGEEARLEQAVNIFERVTKGKYPLYTLPIDRDIELVISQLQSSGADHNEKVVKILAPLTKVHDAESKGKIIAALSQLSPEVKSYILEACKAVKNDQALRLVSYIQIVYLKDAEVYEQLAQLLAQSQQKTVTEGEAPAE